MIPVLQQMFVPAGAAMGAAVSDVLDPHAPQVAGQLSDANTIGDFAAVFVAQELSKPTVMTKKPILPDNTDLSAEALVDAGAFFGTPLLSLPDQTDPPLSNMDHSTNPMMPTSHDGPSEPAVLSDLGIGAADVIRDIADFQTKVTPAAPKETPRHDTTPIPQIKDVTHLNLDAKTRIVLPKGTEGAPEKIGADPKARVVSEDPMKPVPQETLRQPTVVQQPQSLPQDMAPIVIQPIVSVPKTSLISAMPLVSSAESMFQTQIDTPDITKTEAGVALPTVPMPRKSIAVFAGLQAAVAPDVDGLPTTVMDSVQRMQDHKAAKIDGPAVNDEDAEPDLVSTAAPLSTQDAIQNLGQNLGKDATFLATKADVAPIQNASTLGPAPNSAMTTPQLAAPQLAAQILPHSRAAKTGAIEVLLNPAELGHLRFQIHQKGDHVQVVLSAERPETLDLLRRNGEQLATEFRAAGFSGASLSFGQWGRSSDGQPPASFIANAEDDFVPVVLPQSAKPPLTLDNSRNLNLRL